jgi:ABC-2 type transport system permease protein
VIAAQSAPNPADRWGFALVPRLLAYRFRMVSNAALRGGRERRGWTLILAIVISGAVLAGYRITGAALQDDAPSPERLQPAVSGGLGMIAGFTLITAITFALSAFYFAKDLDTLLVSPLPGRSVLLTKLCVQLGTGASVGALLMTPPLLAYMQQRGTAAFLPLVGVTVVAMAALPLAAGTALTIAAVRIIPARRVRDAGGLLVTLVVFGVTAVNLLVRGPDGFTSAPGPLDPSGQAGVAASLWLPTGWASRGVLAALRGDGLAALGWAAPLVLSAVAALLLVSRLGERAFVGGFMRSAEAGSRRTRRAANRTLLARRTGVRRPWTVLAAKDLREIRRDASQLGQLFLPIALFAVYIAAPGSRSGFQDASTRLPPWFGPALTAGFASLFAASGIALRGVGMEGRRLWLIRSAPVDAWQVLRAKLAVGLGIAGTLGVLLVGIGAVRNRVDPLTTLLVAARMLVIIAGMVGLAAGLGAIRPRLDWTDPRRSVGLGLSIGFLGMGSLYLGFIYVILGVPYAARNPSASAIAAADVVVALVALGTASLALHVGARRLRALEL